MTAPSAALAEATRRRVAPPRGGVPLTHRIPVDPVRGLATGIAWPSAPSAGAGTRPAGDGAGVAMPAAPVDRARTPAAVEASTATPARRAPGVAVDDSARPDLVPLTRVDRATFPGVAHRAGPTHARPPMASPSGPEPDDAADAADRGGGSTPPAGDAERRPATDAAGPANLGRSRRLGLGPPLRGGRPARAADDEADRSADLTRPTVSPAPIGDLDAGRAEPPSPPVPDLLHTHRQRAAATADQGAPPTPAVAVPEVEPVPSGLARDLAPILGTDIGDAVLHRGESARRLAAQHRARAVTAAGEVYLPREQGELEDRRTRGLLAHELTHVAQQRRQGDRLPAEESVAGRVLEAEAQAVERHVRGEAPAPQAPAGPPPPAASPPSPPAASPASPPAAPTRASATVPAEVMDDLVSAGLAVRDATGSVRFRVTVPPEPSAEPPGRDDRAAPAPADQSAAASAPGHPAAAAVQRATDDVVVAPATHPAPPPTQDPPAPAPVTVLFQMPAEAPASRPAATTPVDAGPSPNPVTAPESAAGPVERAATTATAGAAPSPGTGAATGDTAVARTSDAPGDAAAPSVMEDIDLDDLSRRIYERLRRRLRSELLVDRERAGLATDLIR